MRNRCAWYCLVLAFAQSVNASLTVEVLDTNLDPVCPDNNGTLYSTYNSETFVVECGIDRNNGDIGNMKTNTFAECIDLCANTTSCVDVSWAGGSASSSGTCYMKDSITTFSTNTVWGARWANTTYLAASVVNNPPAAPASPQPTYGPVYLPVQPSDFTDVPYTLVEDMRGISFLDHFQFGTDPDPTSGTVEYVNREIASRYGMYSTYDDHTIWGVDNVTIIHPNTGVNRKSIRLTSNNNFTLGLFLLDLNHMPFGCGTWPAWWTVGNNWPNHGEIDIIEGVNTNNYNSLSLHTAGTECYVSGTGALANSTYNGGKCSYDGGDTTGCSFADTDPQSYGAGLNDAGGGIYAMEWTPDWIRMWFFNRTNIPASINAGHPNTTEFGTPRSNFEFLATNSTSNCTIPQRFLQHQIIFDTTLCGSWAGPNFNLGTDCPVLDPNPWTSCNDYILANPASMNDAYWSVNFIQVYQRLGSEATFDSNITEVVEIDSPLTTCTLCPAYNDTTFIYGGYRWQMLCGFDTATASVSTNATQTDSFGACIAICIQSEDCLAVTWNPSTFYCYYKFQFETPFSNAGTLGFWNAQLFDTAITPNVPSTGATCSILVAPGQTALSSSSSTASIPKTSSMTTPLTSTTTSISSTTSSVMTTSSSMSTSSSPTTAQLSMTSSSSNSQPTTSMTPVTTTSPTTSSVSSTSSTASTNLAQGSSSSAISSSHSNPDLSTIPTFLSSSLAQSSSSSTTLNPTSSDVLPPSSLTITSSPIPTPSSTSAAVSTSIASQAPTTGTVSSPPSSALSLPSSFSTTTTSTTTSFTPLPTSSITPLCDTIFLNPDGTTYRIYCNAVISGSDLYTQTPSPSFPSCIALCDSYNITCIGSIFYNGTEETSCVLKANSTGTEADASSMRRLREREMSKRDGAGSGNAVDYQSQAFAAYHLVDPAVYEGPPAPPPLSSSSSTGVPTANPSPSSSLPIPPSTSPPSTGASFSSITSSSSIGRAGQSPGPPGLSVTTGLDNGSTCAAPSTTTVVTITETVTGAMFSLSTGGATPVVGPLAMGAPSLEAQEDEG